MAAIKKYLADLGTCDNFNKINKLQLIRVFKMILNGKRKLAFSTLSQ
jgi:hypothetical protein